MHLVYKLPGKKLETNNNNNNNNNKKENEIVSRRKTIIQETFKAKLDLFVDLPDPGYRNTNDGNTSRRFFIDPSLLK